MLALGAIGAAIGSGLAIGAPTACTGPLELVVDGAGVYSSTAFGGSTNVVEGAASRFALSRASRIVAAYCVNLVCGAFAAGMVDGRTK